MNKSYDAKEVVMDIKGKGVSYYTKNIEDCIPRRIGDMMLFTTNGISFRTIVKGIQLSGTEVIFELVEDTGEHIALTSVTNIKLK